MAWSRRRWLRLGGAVVAAGLADAAAARPTVPVVWPALRAVDGRALDPVRSAGVPMVVVFWATWCAHCQRHNARIDALFRRMDPARLQVLGIAMDREPAAVRSYLAQHGYGFPVVLDEGRLRGLFTTRRIVPMTCLLDGDGHLVQSIPGEMAEDDVMALAALARPAR